MYILWALRLVFAVFEILKVKNSLKKVGEIRNHI